MPEVRVSTVVVVVLILGAVGLVVAGFTGVIAIGWFNQKNLKGALTGATAKARGFTPAKTPEEAMEKFREAIERREYQYAAIYCTKPYADFLEKSHENASNLGSIVDKFRNWGDEKSLLTDKLIIALYQIDPFPSNFVVKGTTKEVNGKATGEFQWITPSPTTRKPNVTIIEDLKDMDPRMFTNVLAFGMFSGKMALVKEEDAWKIDVPMNAAWQGEINYFNERSKHYTNRLRGFWDDVNNQRYAGESTGYQSDIFQKFRDAK